METCWAEASSVNKADSKKKHLAEEKYGVRQGKEPQLVAKPGLTFQLY